jgi:lysozyme family protein
MISAFALAIDFVLAVEGGFVDDPQDPGGKTKFGISAAAFPAIDIESLTEKEAVAIYWTSYAEPIAFEQLAEISEVVAIVTFDASVHHGPQQAIRFLQVAVGMANGGLDGKIGPKTLAAVEQMARIGEEEILIRMHTERLMFFHNLVNQDPERYKFLRGWFRRVVLLNTTQTMNFEVELENDRAH